LHLLYALAYFRQLRAQPRDRVLAELSNIGYSELAGWLKEHFNQELEAQLAAVNLRLGIAPLKNPEVLRLVKLHDVVISLARSLRIGLEAEADDPAILAEIANTDQIRQVIFGLRPAAVFSKAINLAGLRHLLDLLNKIEERASFHIVELPDGTYYIYNEYILKYLASQAQEAYAVDRQGLEHLIKIDMARKAGLFYEVAHSSPELSSQDAFILKLVRAILLQEPDKAFSKWDDQALIYRHAELAPRVFEIEKSPKGLRAINISIAK